VNPYEPPASDVRAAAEIDAGPPGEAALVGRELARTRAVIRFVAPLTVVSAALAMLAAFAFAPGASLFPFLYLLLAGLLLAWHVRGLSLALRDLGAGRPEAVEAVLVRQQRLFGACRGMAVFYVVFVGLAVVLVRAATR
jgi:hypothetical protein